MSELYKSIFTQAMTLPYEERLTLSRELVEAADDKVAADELFADDCEAFRHRLMLSRLKDMEDNPDDFVDSETLLRQMRELVESFPK